MSFANVATLHPNDIEQTTLDERCALVLDTSGLRNKINAWIDRKFHQGMPMFTETTILDEVKNLATRSHRDLSARARDIVYSLDNETKVYRIDPHTTVEGTFLLDCWDLLPKNRATNYALEFFDPLCDAIDYMLDNAANMPSTDEIKRAAKKSLIRRRSFEFVEKLIAGPGAELVQDMQYQALQDYAFEIAGFLVNGSEKEAEFTGAFERAFNKEITFLILDSSKPKEERYEHLRQVRKCTNDVRLALAAYDVAKQGYSAVILTSDSDFEQLIYLARKFEQ